MKRRRTECELAEKRSTKLNKLKSVNWSPSGYSVGSIVLSRWIAGLTIPVLFIFWGLNRKSLTPSGAIAGYFVGFIITLSNYVFLSCLATFFVTSSKATKFRSHLKRKQEENFLEGGGRNWVQVLCNGSVGAIIAFIYILDCGCREQPVDLVNKYKCSMIFYAFLGTFSCTNGDTWASELGSVFQCGKTVLISTFKSVPKGTNGAISVAGTLFSFIAGGMVGLASFLSLHLTVPSEVMELAPSQWNLILYGAFGGLLGSFIDSILGATLQYSGIDKDGTIVEHPGPGIKHISGRHLLDNHSVNLLSCAITSFLLPFIALYTSP